MKDLPFFFISGGLLRELREVEVGGGEELRRGLHHRAVHRLPDPG